MTFGGVAASSQKFQIIILSDNFLTDHPLPPNNYPSYFSGPAWQLDPATKQFYLHLFAVKQPDLNWDNPKVREDVFSLMRFWLDKGVDGFRMDVIPLISKQLGLPDLTPEQLKDPSQLWANGPHRDEYLRQMNREVLSKYDTARSHGAVS